MYPLKPGSRPELPATAPNLDSAPTSALDAKAQPVQSSDLFNGRKFVCIEHRGETYRLQTTKLGKLILTK